MGLKEWLKGGKTAERDSYPLSLDGWMSQLMTFNGNAYPLLNQTLAGSLEHIGQGYEPYVNKGLKGNAVVFACMGMRLRVFSQARFQFRQVRAGVPGDLFGNQELAVLETPWTGATTGDLLARCILDADIAGNSFSVRRGDTIRRLRPDWVSIVIGSNSDSTTDSWDIDADVLGYMYHPGGRFSGREPVTLDFSEVAHFAPNPDPLATFRGMSWLTPVIREVEADSGMTAHKNAYLDNAATPNLSVKFDPQIKREDFEFYTKKFREEHEGTANAYKTLFLGGGADVTVVGSDLKGLDFKATQGSGETRIAAAAGIPPVIVGLSEGLSAATYSNYGQARRSFADTTLAHLWQNMAGSMATIINVPARSELWYDSRHIPFLAEDQKDAADIEAVKAQTIRSLIDGGFTADSAVDAVMSGDMSRLKHTGLFSVQLQAPGSVKMPVGEVPGEIPAGGVGNPTKPETVPAGDVQPAKPPKDTQQKVGTNGKVAAP